MARRRSFPAGEALRRVAGAFAVGLLTLAAAVASGPTAWAAECAELCPVEGDAGHQYYHGALLLPPSTSSADGTLVTNAARCADCVWELTPACLNATPDPELLCLNAVSACPPPALLTAIWLQRPPEPAPRRVGTFCHTPGEALTPAGFVPGVRDQFIKLLPRLAVTYQPAGRSLVNLPTLFATHQPTNLGRPTFALAGHPIVLTATAHWTVDFGDGAKDAFEQPGGPYPNTDIAHPYRQPGTFTVTVVTTWSGQFTVDGLGPFPVTGLDITQRQVVTVPVKESRAILVGD